MYKFCTYMYNNYAIFKSNYYQNYAYYINDIHPLVVAAPVYVI